MNVSPVSFYIKEIDNLLFLIWIHATILYIRTPGKTFQQLFVNGVDNNNNKIHNE